MSGSVILWDGPSDPTQATGQIWYWGSYASGKSVSVPRYLEDHAERLRSKYLAIIHDLGNVAIAGRRLIDHLERHRGFSFWWMTQLAEKSPFKSPRLYGCLRLLALEEMLRAEPPATLNLMTGDRDLVLAVRELCHALGIAFRHCRPSGNSHRGRRRLYTALPYPIQGLLYLARHLAQRWRIGRRGTPEWFGGPTAVSFFSYFINLGGSRAEGEFRSGHWGVLPNLLHEQGAHGNWLHHFIVSAAVPDVDTALAWTERFNHDRERQGAHGFVDSELGVGVVIRAISDWLWLIGKSWRLRDMRRRLQASESSPWLWPLMRADWLTSMRGTIAMSNCLWFALFDRSLSQLPRQGRGFYLYECQGWERAMLHAWRAHGHGEIIGVQHATVPFWHLYYFDAPRTWHDAQRCAMPMPDRVAVNGAAPRQALAAAGFPADRLVEVEALRYLDLPAKKPRREATSARDTLRILILGDMITGATEDLLRMTEEAAGNLPASCTFTFKPHPANRVGLSAFPKLRAAETAKPLDGILGEFDVALSANSTSAAADAYAAGLPVIIILDSATLNLSPLRGQPDVRFVSTAEELAEAITTRHDRPTPPDEPLNLFTIDPELPRWRHLLANH